MSTNNSYSRHAAPTAKKRTLVDILNSVPVVTRKKVAIILLLLTVVICLIDSSGCSTMKADSGRTNCAIIYANRMNSAASPSLAQSQIASTVESHGYLDIVRADGAPASAVNGGTCLGSNSDNESNRGYEESQQLSNALSILDGVTASADEIDMAAAIEYANRSLATAPEGENVVVICDSGISTAGIIDFAASGMLDAEPDAFVRYLETNGLLPDLGHIDKIVWYSFGDVSDTQESIPQNVKANMEALYTAFLKAAGVKEVVFEDGIGAAVQDASQPLPSVTAVAMPQAPSFAGAGSTVRLSQAVLSFVGDSDQFIDEENAKAVLGGYASALVENPSIKAIVTGYTASYPSDENWPVQLSTMRAQRVRDILCALGASTDQVTAIGGGVGPVADLDESGHQIESLSAQNRYVEIDFI